MGLIEVLQENDTEPRAGAVVRNKLATTATILNSKSRHVVVRRVTRTKRIVKKIIGTLKRASFESVSVQEEGTTNEKCSTVEYKMPEASSTEVLKLVLGSIEVIDISRG